MRLNIVFWRDGDGDGFEKETEDWLVMGLRKEWSGLGIWDTPIPMGG
jgi:hypothetical protein